jgi:acyl dehydratase
MIPESTGRECANGSVIPFAVEAGKIREFADAVHDPRPEVRSVEAARALGLSALLAPIAFTRASMLQEPPGASVMSMLGADASSMRHAGHAWRINEPLRAGYCYRLTPWRIATETQRSGQDGRSLRFITVDREIRAADGSVSMFERMTSVVIGPGPAAPPAAGRAPGASPLSRDLVIEADWRTAAPGQELASGTIGPVGLTDIVRMAGAIGDFTPIHHDTAVAHRAGLPDVIAMGMLQVGVTLAVIEGGYGTAAISDVAVRFHDALLVGETLRLSIVAAADSETDRPRCEFNVTTLRGPRIISGAVTAGRRAETAR